MWKWLTLFAFAFIVPSDFSYLPEKSFLRAAIDFIIEGGKKGKQQKKSYMGKTSSSDEKK